LVGHHPTNQLIGRGPVHRRLATFPAGPNQQAYAELATLSGSYSPPTGMSPTRYSAVCHSPSEDDAFDLHVLGTPPAFTLSQDQTLHHDYVRVCPLNSLQGTQVQKMHSTEVSLPHLSLFPYFWHALQSFLPTPSHNEEVGLCSTLLLFRCSPGPEIGGHKKPRN
jgi:hypothetical protein